MSPCRVDVHSPFLLIDLIDDTMLVVQSSRVEAIAIGKQLLKMIGWTKGIVLERFNDFQETLF
jgi:hypothetical protein